jgi:hypothetical protein
MRCAATDNNFGCSRVDFGCGDTSGVDMVKTNMVVEMKEECWRQPILYTCSGLGRFGARTTYLNNQYNAYYRDPTGPRLYYAGTYPGDLLRSFPQRPVDTPTHPELRPHIGTRRLKPLAQFFAISPDMCNLPDFRREFDSFGGQVGSPGESTMVTMEN